jgi:hypothetical protein
MHSQCKAEDSATRHNKHTSLAKLGHSNAAQCLLWKNNQEQQTKLPYSLQLQPQFQSYNLPLKSKALLQPTRSLFCHLCFSHCPATTTITILKMMSLYNVKAHGKLQGCPLLRWSCLGRFTLYSNDCSATLTQQHCCLSYAAKCQSSSANRQPFGARTSTV